MHRSSWPRRASSESDSNPVNPPKCGESRVLTVPNVTAPKNSKMAARTTACCASIRVEPRDAQTLKKVSSNHTRIIASLWIDVVNNVFGGAHPLTVGLGKSLRKVRAALRARETPTA